MLRANPDVNAYAPDFLNQEPAIADYDIGPIIQRR